MEFFPLSGDRYHKNKTEQKPSWDKSIVDWFYKEAEKITYKNEYLLKQPLYTFHV